MTDWCLLAPFRRLRSELGGRAERHIPDEVRVRCEGAREDDVDRGLRPTVRQLDRRQVPGRQLGAKRNDFCSCTELAFTSELADEDGDVLVLARVDGRLDVDP